MYLFWSEAFTPSNRQILSLPEYSIDKHTTPL